MDVEKLDALINLMGEVVSTHKKVETHARHIHGLFLELDDFQSAVEQKKQALNYDHPQAHSLGAFFDSLHGKTKQLNLEIHQYLGQFQPLMTQMAQLIFNPGLSTAAIITDISGRGVGMDVVRENIENTLNGVITVDTLPGQGTTFHIRLPETIAIIHVFLVTLNSMCYAIPASHVTEIISIPGNEIFNAQDKAVLRLRGELVPVVSMGDVLSHAPLPNAIDIKDEISLMIIISGQGEDRMGMIIDSLLSEEEQVVKPLPPHMQGMPVATGAILSDIHVIKDENIEDTFVQAIDHAWDHHQLAREKQRLMAELEEKNKELKQLSYLDGLTGISNRRYFDKILAKEWRRVMRDHYPISIAMIDIDYFKIIQ